jgi:hypothetical protein
LGRVRHITGFIVIGASTKVIIQMVALNDNLIISNN